MPPDDLFVGDARLNIGFHCQEQHQWCWAACAQMVLEHFSQVMPVPSQCEIAGIVLGGDCCENHVNCSCTQNCPGSGEPCDTSAFPEHAFDHYGIQFKWMKGALSLADLRTAIESAPVLVYLESGFAHMVVVYGVRADGTCEVYDPLSGTHFESHGELLHHERLDWEETYFDFRSGGG